MGKGMYHQFVLVKSKDVGRGYEEYPGIRRYELHDDFVSFVMLSSLKWIPTYNLSTGENCYGLNLYGPTAIQKDGADTAKKVFTAWRDLILAAPDNVCFHCGHEFVDGEKQPFNPEFKKAVLLENLNGILSYLQQVGDEFTLVHLGI